MKTPFAPAIDQKKERGNLMKCWPLVRHARWVILLCAVNRHYNYWRQLGYLPINAQSDYEVLDRIWRGDA